MKTIENVIQQLTDTKAILNDLLETLKNLDPAFLDVEVKYLSACTALEKELGGTVTPSLSEYLAAEETAYAARLIYIGWQGFRLNLDIFHNPVNALMLQGDYEELHRERRLETLPVVQKAGNTVRAFQAAMREHHSEQWELMEPILDFYSYLATTGYKIAHYFGFRLADRFGHYVIPGYVSDGVTTLQYASRLGEFLRIDLDRLE